MDMRGDFVKLVANKIYATRVIYARNSRGGYVIKLYKYIFSVQVMTTT